MSNPETQQAYAQGYHVGYQHGLQAAQGGGQNGAGPAYPFNLTAVYPQSSSRLLMFFWFVRGFALIPHLFCLWFLSMATGFVMLFAWFAVVFTGQYPKGLWDFMTGVMRWQTRCSAYMLALTDEYPPFSLN